MSIFLEAVQRYAPDFAEDCQAILAQSHWVLSDSDPRVLRSTCGVATQEVTVDFVESAASLLKTRQEVGEDYNPRQIFDFSSALHAALTDAHGLKETFFGVYCDDSALGVDKRVSESAVSAWTVSVGCLGSLEIKTENIHREPVSYEVAGKSVSVSPEQALVLDYLIRRACAGDYTASRENLSKNEPPPIYFNNLSLAVQNTCDRLFLVLNGRGVWHESPYFGEGVNRQSIWVLQEELDILKATRPSHLPQEFPVHKPLKSVYRIPVEPV